MTSSAREVGPGDVAFITGGAQGIGLAIARALTQKGVKVALADVDADKLALAREELADPGRVGTFVLDVRDRDAFADVAGKVEQVLGPVTLLFNNAGVAGGAHVSKMAYETWDWMLGINLDGVVNGLQTFVPRMLAREEGGYVVNTSSGAGVVEADTGFLYTTAKFAVVGLSESLHKELEPFGIGVSVLCPGRVATDIVRNTWGLDRPEGQALDPVMREALEAGSLALQSGTSPDRVAELVLEAMGRGQLHVFTDDELRNRILARTEVMLAALDAVAAHH